MSHDPRHELVQFLKQWFEEAYHVSVILPLDEIVVYDPDAPSAAEPPTPEKTLEAIAA